MNLGKKIISVAAAAALVAGAGAMAATPAAAKTKYSGSTVLTFDKKLAPIVSGIVRIKPAKGKGARISFPVTGVADGGAIIHKGGIGVGAVEVSDPVIVIDEPNNSARILVTLAGGAIELFTVRNFKAKKSTAKMELWQGALRLTSNEFVVEALNDAVGKPAFRPGMAMGKIKTTIKIKK